MDDSAIKNPVPGEEFGIEEWIESLDAVLKDNGPEVARQILERLRTHAHLAGVDIPFTARTAFANTLPARNQPLFPGDQAIERRIKSLIRWNALAMVVRANRVEHNIGGHISTYASAATLYEVGFNHFFRARTPEFEGDTVYFQGHAAPGIYARAFLEGRLSAQQLENFRRELKPGGGLSSYPHPWLMPDFWEFPTVSMGLSPIMAIYQARFNRYLEDRGLKPVTDAKVWAFLGDGETDEPEALGAITLASREKLDNLIFVVNCNLQRLDGPVRGNGQIIQELEAAFRGAGWNVIKVLWGSDWDPLFELDTEGVLVQRMGEPVDGEYQKIAVAPGAYVRQSFFGTDPRLLKLVEPLSDEAIHKLRLGGHDPRKVYAAYKAATERRGMPTVILARTIKGYGLGESGEGRNVTHQQKKLNEDEHPTLTAGFGDTDTAFTADGVCCCVFAKCSAAANTTTGVAGSLPSIPFPVLAAPVALPLLTALVALVTLAASIPFGSLLTGVGTGREVEGLTTLIHLLSWKHRRSQLSEGAGGFSTYFCGGGVWRRHGK